MALPHCFPFPCVHCFQCCKPTSAIWYQQFAEESAKEASIPAQWTDIDQAELDALRNALIKLSNTAYGRFKEQMKRDFEQAYAKMSAKEKETLKQKIADINKCPKQRA